MAVYDGDPLPAGALCLPLAGHVFDRSLRIHRPREGLFITCIHNHIHTYTHVCMYNFVQCLANV